ncbi:hypothetical protein M3O96_10130 [Aquiflexum sp. TKW24L]|uniref:hypothetical protein n=1 Tax=Aquiflexum sp. TKW24L TaxID=2942212 RepID=UPI0020BFAC13|nr:hypothetical protein [Aquiflexum sp. TKW24L]
MIIVTVFLYIAVLILLFKTFKSTIIVLSKIPLGMVGALAALWITGNIKQWAVDSKKWTVNSCQWKQ